MDRVHLPIPQSNETNRFTLIGLKELDEQPDRQLPLPFDALKYLKSRPPKFNGCKQQEASTFESKQEIIVIDSSDSECSDHEEGSETLKIVIKLTEEDLEQPQEKVHLRLPTNPGRSSLLFKNPTSSLNTRWDVVIKNLMRDCRRYFFELFQSERLRTNK